MNVRMKILMHGHMDIWTHEHIGAPSPSTHHLPPLLLLSLPLIFFHLSPLPHLTLLLSLVLLLPFLLCPLSFLLPLMLAPLFSLSLSSWHASCFPTYPLPLPPPCPQQHLTTPPCTHSTYLSPLTQRTDIWINCQCRHILLGTVWQKLNKYLFVLNCILSQSSFLLILVSNVLVSNSFSI